MSKTLKRFRLLTTLFLIFAVFASLCVPASAAGVETWYNGYVLEPTMYFTGGNLTPVKTMGATGTLYVTADFVLTDTSTYSTAALCILEIRDTSNNVLVRKTGITYKAISMTATLAVTSGQQIQIYTGMYDYSTGVARSAQVEYSHYIS